MSDLNQNPGSATDGQVATTPGLEGATVTTPEVSSGQVASQDGATEGQAAATTSSTPAVDTFYDPASLPDELKTIYKQMQSAFTKKTQVLAQDRQLLEAAKEFVKNPVQHMQRIAAEHGYVLTQAQAQAALNTQTQPAADSAWEPKTWDEVLERAESRALEKVMKQLSPFLQNVQQIQAKSIEQKLDSIDQNWRMYEDDMRATLQAHPSMVSDVEKLYRLSVPEEVYSSRAVQVALNKLQSKTNQASVGSRSSTSRTVPAPKVPKNFSEAVELAKQQLAQQGG